MTRFISFIGVPAFAAAAIAAAAWADPGVVITHDGQKLHGDVSEVGDAVEVAVGRKVQRFARSDVKSVRYDEEIETEYQARSRDAGINDPAAQAKLLEWCIAQGQPEIISRQAYRVLQLQPDHEAARTAMKEANDIIAAERAAEQAAADERKAATDRRKPKEREPKADGDGAAGRRLTKDEVNRLRFMELRLPRTRSDEPENVRVTIPGDVAEEFLRGVQGRTGYEGREGREQFMKLAPHEKLARIVVDSGRDDFEKFVSRIEIRSDPEVFATFKSKVMPRVIQGCASARCHGGAGADETGLRLFDDPLRSPETTYANFLVLNEYTIKPPGGREYRMIDRARPDDSLLLAWLTRPDATHVPVPHPGESKLKPLFRTREHPGYVAIREWIDSLREPQPDYGVRIRPAPTSQPAGKPTDEDDDD
ncbi:MAG: hypothetical protein HUU22_00635 [Phycisphaerae bacterium]|nr:hypothetical protein [Phycisphaerae bacterium]NUQ44520.1 hypothetical protein [Phycisphaerae bacterium]